MSEVLSVKGDITLQQFRAKKPLISPLLYTFADATTRIHPLIIVSGPRLLSLNCTHSTNYLEVMIPWHIDCTSQGK